MIPSPWVAVILTLGTARLIREASYSDFPPVLRFRRWLVGWHVAVSGSPNSLSGLTSETPTAVESFRRPTLAKFVSCIWCIGFWASLAVYVAWVFEPRWTLYVVAPLALSTVAALALRWLDP